MVFEIQTEKFVGNREPYIFSYQVKNNLWEKSDILFYRALIFWLVDNWGLQLTIGMKVFLELYYIFHSNIFWQYFSVLLSVFD